MTAIHDATNHEYLEVAAVYETYNVAFEAAGQHIGLVPGGGPQGMTSPLAYWHVPDISAKLLPEMTAAGATVKEPAHNVLGLLQDR